MCGNSVCQQNDSEAAQGTLSAQCPLFFFSLFLRVSPWAKKVPYWVLSDGNSCRDLARNKARMCLFCCLLSLFSQWGAPLLIYFYPKQRHLPLVPHAQSIQLHMEYTQIYRSTFGSFTSSLQIHFARVSVRPKFSPVCCQNVRVENSRWVLQKQRAGSEHAAVLDVLLLLPQEAKRVPPASSDR